MLMLLYSFACVHIIILQLSYQAFWGAWIAHYALDYNVLQWLTFIVSSHSFGLLCSVHRVLLDHAVRGEAHAHHPFSPMGCSGPLFSERAGARLVGSMTRFGDMPLDKGDRLIGIRFHPGVAGLFLSLPAAELVDATTEVRLPEAEREGCSEGSLWLRPQKSVSGSLVALSPSSRELGRDMLGAF